MNKNTLWIALIIVILGLGIWYFYKPTPIIEPSVQEVVLKPTYVNASADLIKVENPFPGAVTGKTFTVIGQARGYWYFKASFPIELQDKNGKVIALVPA